MPKIEKARKEPTGIGGWLILPIIGLVVTSLSAFAFLIDQGIPLLHAATWPTLPTSGRALLTFEVFGNLLFVIAPVTLLVLLFQKRRVLPRLLIGFYVLLFLVVLADGIGILAVGPQLIPDELQRQEAGFTGTGVTSDIARVFWACAIWIPYFIVSKRVKNTFVNQPVSTAYAQNVPAVMQPDGHIIAGITPTATPAGPKTRSPHATRNWLLGASAAVLVAVLGTLIWNCAAPPEPASTSASEVTNMKTYADPTYDYSFDYPAGWRIDNSTTQTTVDDGSLNSVMVFDPQGKGTGLVSYTMATVSVYDLGDTFVASMLPELGRRIEAYLDQSAQAGELKMVVPMAATTLAGLSGQVVTLADTAADMPTTATMYYLYHGSFMYVLSVQAASTEWDADQAVFDEIIASFKLTD